MTVRRRQKKSRLRGSHTHAWGTKKKHRNAGSRSGRGNAGRGKRSGHKQSSFLKKGIFLGHSGFTPHGRLEAQGLAVNIDYLEEQMEKFVQLGLAQKKGDICTFDVGKLGYTKVLGNGNIKSKMHIIAAAFSKQAEEKLAQAGGKAENAESPAKSEEVQVKSAEPKSAKSAKPVAANK